MTESVLFNFTKNDLLPIVNSLVHEPVNDFDIRFNEKPVNPDHIMNGIQGDYYIPTISCGNKTGGVSEFTIFVRRRNDNDRGCNQAHHYAFLRQQGVSVPEVYGVLFDENGREVLFLEHLEEVKTSREGFYYDQDSLSAFIELMARFNSFQLPVTYAVELGRDLGQRSFLLEWRTWLLWSVYVLDYVGKQAELGELGESLRHYCREQQADIEVLKKIALELSYIIPGLPSGYVHGDFHPGNIGWRKSPRELVVFDLENVQLNTRFYDIAPIIGGWNAERNHPVPQHEVAAQYLKTWCENTGTSIGMEEFIREITLVWYAGKLNLWELLPAEHLNAPSYESGMPGRSRQERIDLVYENLSLLVEQVGNVKSFLRG